MKTPPRYRTRDQIVATTAHEVRRPGQPTRPRYSLYDLWKHATYLAVENEMDELLEQWPAHRARTVALLAVQKAFFDNGATHWEEGAYWQELRTNPDVRATGARKQARAQQPAQAARYERHRLLAEAALVEHERRKQGPPTGKVPRRQPRPGGPKTVLILRRCL